MAREMWNDEKIIKAITSMTDSLKMKTMPTHSEMFDFFGDYKLTNAIRRNGGTKKFAKLMNLEIKKCESRLGDNYEMICANYLQEKFCYKVIQTAPRYPYDLLVENALKIDVKVGKLYTSKVDSKFYTFNLEKSNQTCDIFVCYCLDQSEKEEKVLIIPSYAISGITQLSVGKKSRYDKYINRWDIIEEYVSFIKFMV